MPTITAQVSTFLKTSETPAAELAKSQQIAMAQGKAFAVLSVMPARNQHVRIVLASRRSPVRTYV